jgi:hypothetical protein
MKKGVSIPINTLVMLAVAIIVLLAAVAWFMGAFAPTAQESSLKQKFDSSCMTWTMNNCNETMDGDDDVPESTCGAYNKLMYNIVSDTGCDHDTVAKACGCSEPYGTMRP